LIDGLFNNGQCFKYVVYKHLISVFIISVFGFQKSLGNPNFGFDFFAAVRFGFLKTETEPTFGLPHIPTHIDNTEVAFNN
jgi:hypothetical protein